jgi:uncharacterized membrane protein
MNQKLTTYLSKWHFVRVLQLVFGLMLVASGLYDNEIAYTIIGGIFLIQAFFNLSLCGARGCGIPQRNTTYSKPTIKVDEYKSKR